MMVGLRKRKRKNPGWRGRRVCSTDSDRVTKTTRTIISLDIMFVEERKKGR